MCAMRCQCHSKKLREWKRRAAHAPLPPVPPDAQPRPPPLDDVVEGDAPAPGSHELHTNQMISQAVGVLSPSLSRSPSHAPSAISLFVPTISLFVPVD